MTRHVIRQSDLAKEPLCSGASMISIVTGKMEISLSLLEGPKSPPVFFSELPLKGAEVLENGLRRGPSRLLVGRPFSNAEADS
jgi:hypothetical protein